MGSAGLLPREERQGACKAQCPSRIVPHQVRGTSRRWGSSPRCSTWCSIRCSTFCVVFRLLFLRKSFQINRLRTFWIYPHQPPQISQLSLSCDNQRSKKASVVRHRGFFVFSFALRAHRIVGYERDVISDIATGVTVLHKLFQLQRYRSLVLCVVSPCFANGERSSH